MQILDIDRPDMPDLQFVLIVLALCTSRLAEFNMSGTLRQTIFDRCWALTNHGPPPAKLEDRAIELRPWNQDTLEAMVEVIRSVLTNVGIRTLTWDHPASPPTHRSTPEAQPLVERLGQLFPS